jgi:hypothetical protein
MIVMEPWPLRTVSSSMPSWSILAIALSIALSITPAASAIADPKRRFLFGVGDAKREMRRQIAAFLASK